MLEVTPELNVVASSGRCPLFPLTRLRSSGGKGWMPCSSSFDAPNMTMSGHVGTGGRMDCFHPIRGNKVGCTFAMYDHVPCTLVPR